MAGSSVLRRPLLLVGGLLAALAVVVGVSAAVDSGHEHRREARVRHWQVAAAHLSLSENAALQKRLEAALPSYLVRTSPAPGARAWTQGAGAWTADRPAATVVADVARGLRSAGFTGVIATPTSVRASRPEGRVQVRVVPGPDAATEVHAVTVPALPPCC